MVSLYHLISPYQVCLLCLIVPLPHHALSPPPSGTRLLLNFVIRCLENPDIPTGEDNQQIFTESPGLDHSTLTGKSCRSVIEYFLTSLRAILAETYTTAGASLADGDDNTPPALSEEDDAGDKSSRFVMKLSPVRRLDESEMVKLWGFINHLLQGRRGQHRRGGYVQFRPGVGVEWQTGKSESQNLNIRIRPMREKAMESMDNQNEPQTRSMVRELDPSSDGPRQGERRPELKRGYGSWVDVMRFAVSKRRRHVMSINNALSAISDLMMEQHRNRVLKNRQNMRYHMLQQG